MYPHYHVSKYLDTFRKMEGNYKLFSQIKKIGSIAVINRLFFPYLKPNQILAYCRLGTERNNKNLIPCDDILLWRQYFQRHFTKAYNEYMQSLFSIYKETSNLYYERLQYIVYRDVCSKIQGIYGIRRDDTGTFELDPPVFGFSYGDMKYLLIAGFLSGGSKNFKFVYKLLRYQGKNSIEQQKIKEETEEILQMCFQRGIEESLPLEFIELAYLKTNIDVGKVSQGCEYKSGTTSYYQKSIDRLIQEKY